MGFIVILILFGILLLLAEILLVPGVGVAGVLGLLSLIGSCIYAFNESGVVTGTVVVAVNVILVVGLTVYVLRAKTWKRFTLDTNIESKAIPDKDSVLAVGDVGRTTTRLAPVGRARFQAGEYEVKALEGMLAPGVEVEVALIEDNTVIVKPVETDF
ncbi:MAG: NfeD family protein [Bacteroidetes bacterium]|uniref:NfeD family protein n=1 Tax=Candidatus Cryptobacteroides intestinavium TaxID=2840766 RepID=A0A9D9EQP9_9BACT|nr:NfeD family protein [Candidatus Cryptobacteroides intestinavium]